MVLPAGFHVFITQQTYDLSSCWDVGDMLGIMEMDKMISEGKEFYT